MALCLLLATQTKEWTWVSYAFLTLSGFFQMAHNGAFWAIPPLLFPKNVAGGARGIINGIANLGGFVGPSLVGWFITQFHSPDIGIYVVCASLLLASLLTFTLPGYLARSSLAKGQGA
jgi:nitrate/nitrite transporter NarK